MKFGLDSRWKLGDTGLLMIKIAQTGTLRATFEHHWFSLKLLDKVAGNFFGSQTSRVLQHPPCLVWLSTPTNFIGRRTSCLSSFARKQKAYCYLLKPEVCPGKFSQEEMFSQEVRVRCYWTIVLNFKFCGS